MRGFDSDLERPICEVIEVQKQQEAKFLCSACGAERGCNCNAPAIPKAQQAIAEFAFCLVAALASTTSQPSKVRLSSKLVALMRGQSKKSIELIEAMRSTTEAAQPITGRGVTIRSLSIR